MASDEEDVRQYRAFLEASAGILHAQALQDKLAVVATGVVHSGLFRRCLVSVYRHVLTSDVLVGGAGLPDAELARIRRLPSLSREEVRGLEARGVPLGEHAYYIPASLLVPQGHPATVPSSLPREAFIDWHPDDMFLATLHAKGGDLIGLLTADDPSSGRVPTSRSVHTLVQFSRLASELLEREFALRRDSLTGLFNGSFLDEVLDGYDLAARTAFTALFADMDGLKAVNDEIGHAMGDRYIRTAGRMVQRAVGDAALIFRPYGDEFVAIADADRGTDLLDAPERLDRAVAMWNRGGDPTSGAPLVSASAAGFALSVSAGAAVRLPGEPAHAVVARAEQAMYARKRARQGDLGGRSTPGADWLRRSGRFAPPR